MRCLISQKCFRGKRLSDKTVKSNLHLAIFLLIFCSDAKKKLRLALCSAESVAFPLMAPATTRNGLPDHTDFEGTRPATVKNH